MKPRPPKWLIFQYFLVFVPSYCRKGLSWNHIQMSNHTWTHLQRRYFYRGRNEAKEENTSFKAALFIHLSSLCLLAGKSIWVNHIQNEQSWESPVKMLLTQRINIALAFSLQYLNDAIHERSSEAFIYVF